MLTIRVFHNKAALPRLGTDQERMRFVGRWSGDYILRLFGGLWSLAFFWMPKTSQNTENMMKKR